MPLRVGVLGVAHVHTASYVECLKQEPEVEVVGLYDYDATRGAEAEAKFGIVSLPLDALLDAGLDAVVVCAENTQHRRLVEAAAGRVRAILCEKPIATTLADAQAMLDVCQRTGTRLQMCFPVRFATAMAALKDLLAKGRLGTIHVARATNRGQMPGGWFTDPELTGGGAVMDHTVHVVDLLRWLWPGVEVAEVYAEVGHSLLHPGLGIDDAGLLSLRLSNGVVATLDTSWSRPPSYPLGADVTLELTGENGWVEVDGFGQRLLYAPRQGKSEWVGYGINTDAALIHDFVDMVRTGREPSITGQDGLKALEVALAAYESARSGEPVLLLR
ncbi:MAG: Gfo/Idh/MocA family oxidoreductase [Anaerolineae bacterium]|nr:Gfo/Idh/MocA family oxidoreductase [Anaerolineae bacterium]